MNRSLLRSALAAGLAGATLAAHAAGGVESYFDGSTQVAQLTWTTSGGLTTFSLDFLSAPANPSAFVFGLEFNGAPGAFTDTDHTALSTGSFGSHIDAGHSYNWEVDFATANSHGGANRLTLGETATWTIATTSPFDLDGSLLHVNSFTSNGQSIKLYGVPAVPEPASLPLLLAGLGAVGLVARRRRSR